MYNYTNGSLTRLWKHRASELKYARNLFQNSIKNILLAGVIKANNTVMSIYNQQQQAVILKGIAQQILSMNVPSFTQAEKLFKEFGIDFESNQLYSQMYAALEVALSLGEDSQEFIKANSNLKWSSDIVHRIAHYALNMDKPDVNQLRLKVLTDK